MKKKFVLVGLLILIIIISIPFWIKFHFGKPLMYDGDILFYTENVTEDDARKLGKYLVENRGFKKDDGDATVQLNKIANTYEFRIPVKKGIENDQDNINFFKSFANELSVMVFDGKKVDIHLCNDFFYTKRVVVGR